MAPHAPPDERTGWRAAEPPVAVDDVGAREFVAALVAPGSSTVPRRPVLAAALLVAGVGVPLAALVFVVSRLSDPVAAALDQRLLTVIASTVVVGLLARAAAVAEVTAARRRAEGSFGAAPVVSVAALVIAAVPLLWLAATVVQAQGVIGRVFAEGTSEPIHDPVAGDGADAGATTTNIVLIAGADGGAAVVADTTVLVMIDDATGRTALVGIDADLAELRAPSDTELAAWLATYDGSFGDVPSAVAADPELADSWSAHGRQPGPAALSAIVAATLETRVDDYVVVDTEGLGDLVDAIGDVTVEQPDGEVLELDGAAAIDFIDRRPVDDEGARLDRQVELVEAIGGALDPSTALASFSATATAIGDAVRTSLGTEEFADLADRLETGAIVSARTAATRPELLALVERAEAELRPG